MSEKKKIQAEELITPSAREILAAAKGTKNGGKSVEERMEAGRLEILKVVEGIQGAEKLSELIERGKKKGKLSSSELMEVLETMDLESEQMDKI